MYIFMNILCLLYLIFSSFIRIITKYTCYDYVGIIWNESENVYKNYEIFNGQILLTYVIKNENTTWIVI